MRLIALWNPGGRRRGRGGELREVDGNVKERTVTPVTSLIEEKSMVMSRSVQ